tara:strand:- start:2808 stop:2912 length:105 start_codon:yes stop_codon:yes gene_type:complete
MAKAWLIPPDYFAVSTLDPGLINKTAVQIGIAVF